MISEGTLWGRVLLAGGVKRIAAAVGRDEKTMYRWAQDAERSLLDWFEAVVELLAMRGPDGRRVLVQLREWTEALFRRVLDGAVHPVPMVRIREQAIRLLRETADVIETIGPCATETDCQKLLRETLEARDLLDQIITAARAGVVDEAQDRPMRATR